EIGSRENAPFAIFARFQRVDYPARGRNGGQDGASGIVRLKSGQKLKSRGNQVIPEGDRLIVEMPGGGGLGNATERDPALVADDLCNGLISNERAREVYKVAVREDGSVDVEAAEELRSKKSSRCPFPANRVSSASKLAARGPACGSIQCESEGS